MFPFPDFEPYISPVILQRGEDYFDNGAVHDLQESPTGVWEANVQGNDEYHVFVQIGDDEVTEWDCNCPYDGGPVCKHVVAVLFAVREVVMQWPAQNAVPAGEIWLQEHTRKIEKLLNVMGPDLHREVLVDLCMRTPDFFDELQSRYNPTPGNVKALVSKKLTAAFNTAAERGGFIKYDRLRIATEPADECLVQVQSDMKRGYYSNALETLQAVLDHCVFCMYKSDCENEFSDVIDEALELLKKLGECSLSEEIRREFFSHCLETMLSQSFRKGDWHWTFAETAIVLMQSNEEKMLLSSRLDRISADMNEGQWLYKENCKKIENLRKWINTKMFGSSLI